MGLGVVIWSGKHSSKVSRVRSRLSALLRHKAYAQGFIGVVLPIRASWAGVGCSSVRSFAEKRPGYQFIFVTAVAPIQVLAVICVAPKRMSKYLIKPISSIYLNPNSVYDLKRDLLLFDKTGMLNVDTLLNGLHEYKTIKPFKNALNEVEYLLRKGMFIELTHLFVGKESVLMDDDDRKLADYTMELQKRQADAAAAKDEETRAKLYWQHDELNTRLFCRLANACNDNVFTIPSFSNFTTFQMSDTAKETAYKIVHKLLPLPSDDTPWEKIFDFKNDSESQLKLFALRNWINDLPDDIRADELDDKIKYLMNQYGLCLKRHRIATKVSTIRTIVTTIPKAVSELFKLNLDKAIGAFFSVAEQQVNFESFKERAELPGHELAYIAHVNENINKRNK